jgi:hypothetical protein
MNKILNAKGEPIVLNTMEQRRVDLNQRVVNALGLEIDITTLTTIMKKVTEQKFFQIAPADYMPVRVGEGAWSTNLVTYRSFQLGDDFATGVINTGGNNGKLATADAGVDSVMVKVANWAKSIGWSLFDLEMAAKAGNWDLVTSKEKARKRNWDLGIQKVAFLGLEGDSAVKGLLNQAGITENTSLITKPISSMTTAELKAFTAAIIEAYRSNCARTAWPTHFIIPESDFNGLASQASPDFPIKSTLAVLEETFALITRNKDSKILPLAYSDAAYNTLSKQMYVLLNSEEESIRMDIPVDYTNTLANSVDNFSFQNVGYGQFTGVMAYRPAELLYLSY